MDETWIINGSAADAVMTWLGDVGAQARRTQREESNRPQTPILHAGEIDAHKLPLPVRSRALRAGGVYAQRPSAGRPFGRLHLLVLIEEVDDKALRVEIAATPGFALRSDEVRGSFQQRFPRAARGAAGRRTGLLLRINQETISDHTGAPVLACNVWLEEQLAHLNDRSEKHRLFRPWLDRYRALRGTDPADPARSFRAAVAGCEQRLNKRGIRIRTAAQPMHRTTTRQGRPQERGSERHHEPTLDQALSQAQALSQTSTDGQAPPRSFASEQISLPTGQTRKPRRRREVKRKYKEGAEQDYEW